MIKGGSGRNFIIIEKSDQVGGTWNDNIYPGCCCDGVLSHSQLSTIMALNNIY